MALLDSDSNATIFCNKRYVDEIWNTTEKIDVGMTGGGHLESKQRCNVPLLGEYWFNENSMTNVIALSDMTTKFKVTMDSRIEKSLLYTFQTK